MVILDSPVKSIKRKHELAVYLQDIILVLEIKKGRCPTCQYSETHCRAAPQGVCVCVFRWRHRDQVEVDILALITPVVSLCVWCGQEIQLEINIIMNEVISTCVVVGFRMNLLVRVS